MTIISTLYPLYLVLSWEAALVVISSSVFSFKSFAHILLYKRVNGMLPNYLNDHLVLNNKRHSRDTRFATINAVCPKYKRRYLRKNRSKVNKHEQLHCRVTLGYIF